MWIKCIGFAGVFQSFCFFFMSVHGVCMPNGDKCYFIVIIFYFVEDIRFVWEKITATAKFLWLMIFELKPQVFRCFSRLYVQNFQWHTKWGHTTQTKKANERTNQQLVHRHSLTIVNAVFVVYHFFLLCWCWCVVRSCDMYFGFDYAFCTFLLSTFTERCWSRIEDTLERCCLWCLELKFY